MTSVLIVDDSATFLDLAALFLRQMGGVEVVATATGGLAGLAKARELRPQVVLVDLIMPDLPGLQVIPQLRRAQPDVRIIATTLLDTDAYRDAALAAGADAFVSKAALGEELLPSIERVTRATRGLCSCRAERQSAPPGSGESGEGSPAPAGEGDAESGR